MGTSAARPVRYFLLDRGARALLRTALSLVVVIAAIAAWLLWAGYGREHGSLLSPRQPGRDSTSAVSIKARELEVEVILQSLAEQVGAKLTVDPAIHGKMSLVAEDSRFEDAMDAICHSFDCRWSLSTVPGDGARLTIIAKKRSI